MEYQNHKHFISCVKAVHICFPLIAAIPRFVVLKLSKQKQMIAHKKEKLALQNNVFAVLLLVIEETINNRKTIKLLFALFLPNCRVTCVLLPKGQKSGSSSDDTRSINL